jgi:hypothetical protein
VKKRVAQPVKKDSSTSSGELFVQKIKEAHQVVKKAKMEKMANRAQPVVILPSSYLKVSDISGYVEKAEQRGLVVESHQTIKEPVEFGVYVCSGNMTYYTVSKLDGLKWYADGPKQYGNITRRYYHHADDRSKKMSIIEFENYHILFYSSYPSAAKPDEPAEPTSPQPGINLCPII